MKFLTSYVATVALASFSCVFAAPTSTAVSPLTPATASEGSPLMIQWDAASSSKWSNMEIKFMTGANQNMTELFTIASGIDGTSSGPGQLLWTAPEVTPNSAIYFLQFTHSGSDPTWTTRFAVADASGSTTTPPHSTQPEGTAIPWGEGKLVSAMTASGSTASASSAAASSTSSTSTAESTSTSSSASASRASTSSTSAAAAANTSSSSQTTTSSAGTVRAGSAATLALVVAVVACLTV